MNEEIEIEETTSYMVKADVQQQQTEQAMASIANYYKMMYQAYYNGDVQESMFANSLDMTQVQNKNKITEVILLTIWFNYPEFSILLELCVVVEIKHMALPTMELLHMLTS